MGGYARFREKAADFVKRGESGKIYVWYNYPAKPPDWRLTTTYMWPGSDASAKRSHETCADEIHPLRGKRYLAKARNYKGRRPKLKWRWKKGTWRDGGPFMLRRLKVTYQDNPAVVLQRYLYKYDGVFRCNVQKTAFTEFDAFTEHAAVFGATCWNRFKPNKPSFGLAQAIGELKDLPGMLKSAVQRYKNYSKRWTDASLKLERGGKYSNPQLSPKDVGSDYLEYVFGWRPLVNDIKKLVETTLKVDRQLAFLVKNNNKWLKRRGTLKAERDVQSYEEASRHTPILPSYYYHTPSSLTPCKVTVTVTTDVWFFARMKYYIPEVKIGSDSDVWRKKLLRRIYGFEITPALVWELTPWSWFADWFGNVGDVLANLSDLGELVHDGAYVMEHRLIETKYSQVQLLKLDNGGSYQTETSCTIVEEAKERAVANPFGFGSDGGNITPSRAAILAALGLSRLKG